LEVDDCVDVFGEPNVLIDLPKKNGIGGELAPVEIDGVYLDFDRLDCLGGRFHGTLCFGALAVKMRCCSNAISLTITF